MGGWRESTRRMPRRKRHFLHPARPCGPRRRRHKGKEGPGAPAGLPPGAARRGGVRPAGGGARQVTAETRVPGPESQSPRPPRASPTPRAPREPGARHLTMVSGRDDRRAEPQGEGLPFPPTLGEPAPEPRCARSPPCRPSRPRAPSYPLACSVSSSLSPSIPHVSWSSSSRLCWLAADSLSSAIAAAPSGWGGGAPSGKRGATGRARPRLPLVPPTLGLPSVEPAATPTPQATPTAAGPAPPARLRLPPVSAVRPASVGVGPAHVSSPPSAARPPLPSAPAHLGSHGPAQLACPLPPVSAGEAPRVSRSRFRLSRRGPAHPASPLRPHSADTAPPTSLAGSGPFSRRGPAHLGRREGSTRPALSSSVSSPEV